MVVDEVSFGSDVSFWVEKSYISGVSHRESGDRRVGKAFWSPQRKKDGSNSVYYNNLKEVNRGDVVIHLDQDVREFIGVSKVEGSYEEVDCLEGSRWDKQGVSEMGLEEGSRPGYLVPLKNYEEFEESVPVNEILKEENREELDEIRENNKGLFFNKNLNLNQGAYLTRAPNKLIDLMNNHPILGDYLPGEGIGNGNGEDLEVDVFEDVSQKFESSILNGLFFSDEVSRDLVDQVSAAINSGKHIIFTGPPGTGKTRLAENVCRFLVNENPDLYTGFEVTTATADWSTFNTVGGYMPGEEGRKSLEFKPGQFLNRFKKDGNQRNDLLVVDEINRADIDKAFGQLFSVLTGQRVQLPFKSGNGEEVEVVPSDKFVEPLRPHEFVVPKSWRLIGTMNTYDKTSLYEMSYAFMRRFAFIRVGAPKLSDDMDYVDLLENYLGLDGWGFDVSDSQLRLVADVWRRSNNAVEGREIGPAIVKDMLGFIEKYDGFSDNAVERAIINYIFPQLEGVIERKEIIKEIKKTKNIKEDLITEAAIDMLQVSFNGQK